MNNFLSIHDKIESLLKCLSHEKVDLTTLQELTNLNLDELKNFLIDYQQVKLDFMADLQFLYENDPSVKNLEIIQSYTSMFAVKAYRIAHIFPNEIIARQISEYAKSKSGIDIHPKAKIGVPFAIDHGVGVVIGETVMIGKRCLFYHGITLGAKYLNQREQVDQDRHPKIGDDVIIYSNTTILGNIKVPDNLVIYANKFIKTQIEIDKLIVNKKM